MEIITGVIKTSQKVVVYGPEGIGKTTFASMFPDPLFIDVEDSTKKMNVKRTKKPTSWAMLMEQLNYIKHNNVCKTLIIDTIDWAEKLCKDYICSTSNLKSIEDFGYGKGYTKLQEEWGRMLNYLSEIVDLGKHVVLVAHSQMRKFEEPNEIGSYDRFELKLEKKTAPLVKEWADTILFANYQIYVVNVDNQGAAKGKNKAQGGARVMRTTHHPCWDAKNRDGLESEMPFDYNQIAHLFDDQINKQVETVDVSQVEQVKIDENEQVESEPIANISHLPKALVDLMTSNDVTESDIQKVVADKGYFPIDTPVSNYPNEFIEGVLIGAWNQVHETIMNNKIPF